MKRVGVFAAAGMIALLQGLVPAAAQQTAPAADAAPVQVCGSGPVTIAAMPWASARILAQVHALILKRHYGCDTQVVSGDLSATSSSMAAAGRPLVAPEMWIDRVSAIWNPAVAADRVRAAGPSYSGGDIEGWYVPSYVLANHPKLKNAADLGAYWQVFANGGDKGVLLSCPADWACSVINRNLIAALGLSNRFSVAEPESRSDMDGRIGNAVSRRAPILTYYWQPNAAIAQLGLQPLDMGKYNAPAMACLADRGCADPKPSAFAPYRVVNAVSAKLYADAPQIAAYFEKAQMPLPVMNALLALEADKGLDSAQVAAQFVAERGDIWGSWVAR